MTGWRYYCRRYLGFLPGQFCVICGRWYWGGLPWFDWMPWYQEDFCPYSRQVFSIRCPAGRR